MRKIRGVVMKKKWRNRQEQWDYAMSLFREYNIEPANKKMTFQEEIAIILLFVQTHCVIVFS